MAQHYETMKNNTFLARKLEELVILKAVQSFSAKMLPFFNPETYPFFNEYYSSSIMASDSSPTSEYKEFSYPPAGRSTPPPTTSHASARKESEAIGTDPTASKADKETEDLKDNKEHKDKDDVDMSAPDLNPGYKPNERKDEKRDFGGDKGGGGGGGGDKGGGGGDSKLNGGSKLDTAFMLPLDVKEEEEEEGSCIVNCLYYTMQCCECVIT